MLDRGFPLGRADPTPAVHRWRAALCLSNQERDELLNIISGVSKLIGEWDRAGVAGQKRMAASGWFPYAVEIIRTVDPERADRIDRRRAELAASGGGLAPTPFLTGDDLVAAGMSPGPAFRKILDLVYDAQLEGRVQNPGQALELARGLSVEGV